MAPATTDAKPQQPASIAKRAQLKLGFRNLYELKGWLIISSVAFFFVFIRAPYLNPPTFRAKSSPGEFYWFDQEPYKLGIFLHLFAVIPCMFLSIFQFIPALHYKKYVLIHRVNGYVIFVLLTLGNIGAILISRRTMGSDASVQAAIFFLSVSTSAAMILAWYNIRRLQLEEHRKWAMRTMSWMSIIVTMRVIQICFIMFLAFSGAEYYSLWRCDEISYVTGDTPAFHSEFPACELGPSTLVGVRANVDSRLHVGSAVRVTFAAATWLAICLHTFGTELYICLTPRENERLRVISHQRQKAEGFSPPGSAGITADRWGDGMPWNPPAQVKS